MGEKEQKGIVIVHVTSSIDREYGGPAVSVSNLINELKKFRNNQVLLLSKNSVNPLKIGINNHVKSSVVFTNSSILSIRKNLPVNILQEQIDLFHGHGIWHPYIHSMARKARKLGVKYIISPRGMLEPWSLSQKKIKKKIALSLYQWKDLEMASCLHATAPMEAVNLRALGLKNPIAVIPNGVALEDFPLKENVPNNNKRKLLYLSRIHPKKGLGMLIQAWSRLPKHMHEHWELQIVGGGSSKNVKAFLSEIKLHDCEASVVFRGPLYQDAKLQAYHEASIFILPTFSENFGIVVAEALASGTPVITTHGSPWRELEQYDCGWWIPTDVDKLKECMLEAMSLPEETLLEMGKRGRFLVEQRFSMKAVAKQMQELYDWLLHKGPKPTFVLSEN